MKAFVLIFSIFFLFSFHLASSKIVPITNCAALQKITLNSKDIYKLQNDINCQGMDFAPLGSISNPFTATLDGSFYSILNVKIQSTTTNYTGLFAVTYEANIKNLFLYNFQVSANQRYESTGALIGLANLTSVMNVRMTTTNSDGDNLVYGGHQVGGLVGSAYVRMAQ